MMMMMTSLGMAHLLMLRLLKELLVGVGLVRDHDQDHQEDDQDQDHQEITIIKNQNIHLQEDQFLVLDHLDVLLEDVVLILDPLEDHIQDLDQGRQEEEEGIGPDLLADIGHPGEGTGAHLHEDLVRVHVCL